MQLRWTEGLSNLALPATLDLVARIQWGSTNPTVVAYQAGDRLSARLVAIAPGEAAPSPDSLVPLLASAFFQDGSCTTIEVSACDAGQCSRIERVVVEP